MNVRAFGTLAVLGVLGVTGVAASPSVAATPKPTAADRAATHAYLVATEAWDEAQLANVARSTAATATLAGQISSECPRVLAGSPPQEENPSGPLGPAFQTRTSARTEGERNRESKQRDDLQLELTAAVDGSPKQVNREAAVALSGALSPLRWSNPTLTALLHLTVEILQEELAIAAQPVCADMRAWVASGYKTLSPSSKEFVKHTTTLIMHAFELIGIALSGDIKPFPQLLAPYESTADRVLARRTEALSAQLHNEEKGDGAILKGLEATVGLPVSKFKPPIKHRIKKPRVIFRGRTAAGGHFVVRAQPIKQAPRFLHRTGCTANVTIEEPSRPGSGGLFSILSGGGSERCLSRSHVIPEQQVNCRSGLLTIEANLLPATRSVRLLLSDKRTITSPAIRVPARLGGPAGLYYQVVRGPSPIPVSLTEWDTSGNQLTVLKLPAVAECAKQLRKVFPHGIVRLVHESPPQGPAFTIRGTRYRELGHIHFELNLDEAGEEAFFTDSASGGRIEEKVEQGVPPGHRKTLFESKASGGCIPQPHAIVYGLLRARRDAVLAKVAGVLVPLHKVDIPAHLHAGGALAYGAFSPLPTELLVRDAHGKTVARRNLAEAAQADTEKCEGEAEG